MKNIELTQEQKNKLIEMAKQLFPEYKTIQITDGSCDYCLENTIKLAKENDPIHNDWLLIHWFEFCMTYLKYKLQDKLDEIKKLDYDYQISIYDSWWESHPIDYLYKEFKKLKH